MHPCTFKNAYVCVQKREYIFHREVKEHFIKKISLISASMRKHITSLDQLMEWHDIELRRLTSRNIHSDILAGNQESARAAVALVSTIVEQ